MKVPLDKSLLGKWTVLRDPRAPSPAMKVPAVEWQFTETEFIIRGGRAKKEIRLHYSTDASQSPQWITTWKGDNKEESETKGAYRFQEGQLHIVFQKARSMNRPRRFADDEPEFWFYRAVRVAGKDEADQGGTDQPATASESNSEGKEKPKPESEERSQ
ncbi:MAG: TIGR03067 domain-containing protein [Haloferula sp.]